MKLYGFWRSLATYRVKVALALKGVAVEEVSIDILKGMQHQPDYKAVNPQAVVPSLAPGEGGPPLFQSLAIMEWLEETKPQPPLLPRDPRGRARVRGIALIAGEGDRALPPRRRAHHRRHLPLGAGHRRDRLFQVRRVNRAHRDARLRGMHADRSVQHGAPAQAAGRGGALT